MEDSYRKQVARQHSSGMDPAKSSPYIQFGHRAKFGCSTSYREGVYRRRQNKLTGACTTVPRPVNLTNFSAVGQNPGFLTNTTTPPQAVWAYSSGCSLTGPLTCAMSIHRSPPC